VSEDTTTIKQLTKEEYDFLLEQQDKIVKEHQDKKMPLLRDIWPTLGKRNGKVRRLRKDRK
jgi:hypothetical protein